MTAPESWLLVEAIAARLRAITIANGYHTDAGLHVVTEFADIRHADVGAQLYVFLDGEMRTAESSSRKWRDRVAPITVQARFPVSLPTAQRDAHALLTDLDRAIPPDADQLTTDEWNFAVDSLVISQRPSGADIVVVQMTVLVSHRVAIPTA